MKEAFPHPKDDLISGIVSLPQEKRARLASGLTRQLVDGHTLVAQGLKRLGITHVYCVSGTPIRETFAKCGELGIRLIGVRHQQAGVMMEVRRGPQKHAEAIVESVGAGRGKGGRPVGGGLALQHGRIDNVARAMLASLSAAR